MSSQSNPGVPTEPSVFGKVGSAYGICGWLRIFSFTEEARSIFDYQPWFIQRADRWQVVEVESWKRYTQGLIIKVKDVNDRGMASLLTNCEIVVDSKQLLPLKDGEYYWKDLLGCQVVTTSGYELGKIIDMMETGSNDVMVVKASSRDVFGLKERLIPFLYGRDTKKVDLAARIVEVDWDPGF